MLGILNNVKIQGMAADVPQYTISNEAYVPLLGERRLKKQVRLTGVKTRHLALRRQHTSDLCISSAKRLVKHLGWDLNDIKVLVLVTQTETFGIPSTAFYIQNKLGIPKDCVCFDVNLGCSSVDNGIQIVGSLLQNLAPSSKALLLVGDTSGRPLALGYNYDADVIADNILFGAAGAAIAMENVPGEKIFYQNESDGSGYDAIISYKIKGITRMDGEKVYEFATAQVSDSLKKFKTAYKIEESDIDYYVFHQAQKLILDMLAVEADIPDEKRLETVGEYGNTSGTSVIVSICGNKDSIVGDECSFMMTGFGVGLSWGSIYAKIPTRNILPINETDEYDDLGKREEKDCWGRKILLVNPEKNAAFYRMFAQYISEKSATVIMYGTDVDIMEEIRSSLFYPAYIASNVEDLKTVIDSIGGKITGVITDNILENNEMFESLAEVGMLDKCNSYVRVVESAKISDDVEVICGKNVKNVKYSEANIENIEFSDGGVAWTNAVLSGNQNSKLNKSLALCEGITCMLSDMSSQMEKVTIEY